MTLKLASYKADDSVVAIDDLTDVSVPSFNIASILTKYLITRDILMPSTRSCFTRPQNAF